MIDKIRQGNRGHEQLEEAQDFQHDESERGFSSFKFHLRNDEKEGDGACWLLRIFHVGHMKEYARKDFALPQAEGRLQLSSAWFFVEVDNDIQQIDSR